MEPLRLIRVSDHDSKDLQAIFKMEAELFGSHAIGNDVLVPMARNQAVYLFYCAGSVCGYAICMSSIDREGSVYLFSFGISREQQGRGLGSLAFTLLCDELSAMGFKEMELTVAPDNMAAQRIYSTKSVIATDLRPDYYGPLEDRLLWRLKL